MLCRSMEARHQELLDDYNRGNGPFICFSHLSRGQEAVGIGATAALRSDDVMIGTHRGFVEYLGKGMDPLDILAEYLGKRLNTPIAESSILGTGIGAALMGLRPVSELMFDDFAVLAMDHLILVHIEA